MTEQEEFELSARLTAHEMLLAELMIVLYAKWGFGNRLRHFRDRIDKTFSDLKIDEDEPPRRIDPQRVAVHRHTMATIDRALETLARSK